MSNGGAGGYAANCFARSPLNMEWAVARVWLDSAHVEPPALVGSQVAEPEQGFAGEPIDVTFGETERMMRPGQ